MLTQKDFDVKLLGTQEIQNPVPERDWVPENGGIVYPSSIRELDAYTAAGESASVKYRGKHRHAEQQ